LGDGFYSPLLRSCCYYTAVVPHEKRVIRVWRRQKNPFAHVVWIPSSASSAFEIREDPIIRETSLRDGHGQGVESKRLV